MNARILKKGQNCSVIDKTEKLKFLVDGKNYYREFYYACQRAKKAIYISSWDIHSQTKLLRGEKGNGMPVVLVDFLNALLDKNPKLEIYILNWDYYLIFSHKRDRFSRLKFQLNGNKRLRFGMDNNHPVGGSLHQKYVIIDDSLMFIGGLDICQGRWDDRKHRVKNKYRVDPDGDSYQSFHDIQAAVKGPLAAVMAENFRKRWFNLKKKEIKKPEKNKRIWVKGSKPDIENIDISAISFTVPPSQNEKSSKEVEKLYLDSIRKAKKYIYVENQYFAAHKISEAIIKRLGEKEGPEIILNLTNLKAGLFEARAYGHYFNKVARKIRAADKYDHLRIVTPFIKEGRKKRNIKVHSKLTIIDDNFLRIGSSNMSNRSMSVDRECDFSIEAGEKKQVSEGIDEFLADLLAEHIGEEKEVVSGMIREKGLKYIIDNQKNSRRGLEIMERIIPRIIEKLMVPRSIIDPYGPIFQMGEEEAFRKFPKKQKKIIFFAFGALLSFILLATVFWNYLSSNNLIDANNLASLLRNAGTYSYTPLILMLAYLIGRIFFLPISVLILATALLFSPMQAFFYSLLGSTISASANFAIGYLAKSKLSTFGNGWLKKTSKSFSKRGFWSVLLFRIVPIAPSTLVDFLAGASHIKYKDFFYGTLAGLLPGILALSFLGNQVRDLLIDPGGNEVLWILLVLGVIFVGSFFLKKKFL